MRTFEADWETGILVTAEAVSGIGFPQWMELEYEQEPAEACDLEENAAD